MDYKKTNVGSAIINSVAWGLSFALLCAVVTGEEEKDAVDARKGEESGMEIR